MENWNSVHNVTKILNSNTEFEGVHVPQMSSSERVKMLPLNNYNVSQQASPEDKQETDSFVPVIPGEFARHKFGNPSYGVQNYSTIEDAKGFPSSTQEKETHEPQKNTSVSTQSTHINSCTPPEKAISQRHSTSQICIYISNGTCVYVDLEEGINTSSMAILKVLIETEELHLPAFAMDVFALWIVSPELEVQLKPYHKPVKIFSEWEKYLKKYTHYDEKSSLSEPVLQLKRNVFYHKYDEMRLRDPSVIELLYCEAKWNVLNGRYPRNFSDIIDLGSLTAKITLGNFVPHQHNSTYFRNHLREYLPLYACVRSKPWSLFWPLSKLQQPDKLSPESLIVDQLKKISNSIPNQRLMLHYLKLCWNMPYYGAAFFPGQIEERCTSLFSSWLNCGDSEILIAVSCIGMYLIKPSEGTVILALKYGEFVWECAFPSHIENPYCYPCVFVQFSPTLSSRDRQVTCLVQIFSKQAIMIHYLMSLLSNRRRNSIATSGVTASTGVDEIDGAHGEQELDDVMAPLTDFPRTDLVDLCLTNKLDRLALATFDDEGRCLLTTGSLKMVR